MSQRETNNTRTQTGKSPSLYRKGGDLKEEENQVYMIRMEKKEEKT